MDREFLLHYFNRTPNSVGCEVGVWRGEFSKIIYKRLQPHLLHLIDPWIVRPDYQGREYSAVTSSQAQLDDNHKHVTEYFKGDRVRVIRDLFHNCVLKSNQPGHRLCLDWIYIDGDRTECYQDLTDSLEIVDSGGYITGGGFDFRDPNSNEPLVQQAIERFIDTHTNHARLITIKNHQYVFQKL